MRESQLRRMYGELEDLLLESGEFIERFERGRQRSSELEEYYVDCRMPSPDLVRDLEDLIGQAKREEDIQQFLRLHPEILLQSIIGHRGRWFIPKQKLGNQYVTDFLIAKFDSMGFWWYAVELESPNAKLFTQKGDQSAELSHAIYQIHDWRDWLRNNIDYAQRSKNKGGLGLIDIDSEIPAVIIMGRRGDYRRDNKAHRRRIATENRIVAHHYDWLVGQLKP